MASSACTLKKLTVDSAGARKVLNGEGAMSALEEKVAEAVAYADSVGTATYAGNVQAGENRAHGLVYTPSLHAMYSNACHDTLVKTLARLRSS